MDEASLHIHRLCSLGHLSQALSYLSTIQRHLPTRRLLALARSLHRPNNLILSNHLITFYSRLGHLPLARQLFDQMPHRNLVSFTALITAYSHHNLPHHCFTLFSSMLPHHLPNEFALSSVLASAAGDCNPLFGRQVHALAFKTSFAANVFVANALISMYCSCDGYGDDGWFVFQTMPFRNLISWNSMISGFLMTGRPDCSLDLFAHMYKSSIGFDRTTLVSSIASCSGIRQCVQLHCLAIKICFDSEAEVGTALVKAYSGLGGQFEDCYRVFLGVQEQDVVSWTGIIASFAENDPEEALRLFCQMRHQGYEPDRYTLSIVAKACASSTTERPCSALHSLILRSGFGNDVVISNALIHAYARSGSVKLAECVFEQMMAHDRVSWNSLIKAYAAHGQGRHALQAFKCMEIPPDSATFVGLLTACSHGGLLSEGHHLFDTMRQVYGIAPQLDHFACMVDILGRAGRLAEAEALIEQMPMEPDSVVWSALLGACRKHGEARIGERVARKLIQSDPKKAAGYVMMSNMYCAEGSFGDAACVRKEMKEFGVRKVTGLSWIEVGHHVHEFSAGGRRHPQIEAIYAELGQLVGRLKELGYVADTKLVLHEIEEDCKEERLLHHSEKLALVFGLMNASAAQDQLRIMKNIRICEDCHRFMKLASKCVEKEIVVRDSNRFHHFVDGECSCGDYW